MKALLLKILIAQLNIAEAKLKALQNVACKNENHFRDEYVLKAEIAAINKEIEKI